MGALGNKLRTAEGGRFLFWCPGCGEAHMVGPSWTFNGNGDKPTFSPSVLVTGVQAKHDGDGKWTGDWVVGADGQPLPQRCHSFINDGRIQFLPDCTHALAGQTVELPDFVGEP